MKIVNEKPYSYEFDCIRCGSSLIAEIDDIEVGYFGAGYGGDSPTRTYYVTCPVCHTDHPLPTAALTPKARECADKKDPRR